MANIEEVREAIYQGNEQINSGMERVLEVHGIVLEINRLFRKAASLVAEGVEDIDQGVATMATALEGSAAKDELVNGVRDVKEQYWTGSGPESIASRYSQARDAVHAWNQAHHVGRTAIDDVVGRATNYGEGV